MKMTRRILALLLALLIMATPIQAASASDGPEAIDASEAQGIEVTDNDPAPAEPGEEEELVTVSGRIYSEDGDPLMAYEVTAVQNENLYSTQTDEDGSFAFTLSKEMAVTLNVEETDEYNGWTLTTEPASDLDVGNVFLAYRRVDVKVSVTNCTVELTVREPGAEETHITVEKRTSFQFRRHSAITATATACEGCVMTAFTFGEAGTVSDLVTPVECVATAADVTPPEISCEIENEHEWATQKTVTVEVTDNLPDAVSLYIMKGAEEETIPNNAERITDGSVILTANGRYRIYAEDAASNITWVDIEIEKVDREAPVISELTRDNDDWAVSHTYTFTVTDNGELAGVWCNGEALEADGGNYTVTAAENGKLTVTAKDAAGNKSVREADEDKVDTETPSLEITAQEEWSAESNTFVVIASDNADIDSAWYVNENSERFELVLDETGRKAETVYENGTYTVYVRDAAGNEAHQDVVIDHIDKAAPEIVSVEKAPDTEWTGEETTITVQATDVGSGVAAIWWTTGEEWERAEADENGSAEISIPNTETKQIVVQIKAEDKVGRTSEEQSMEVKIDVDAPTEFTMTYSLIDTDGLFKVMDDSFDFHLLFKDILTFTLKAKDKDSGIAKFAYQITAEEAPDEDGWIELEIDDGPDEDGIYSVTPMLASHEEFKGYIYARAYDVCGNATEYITDMSTGKSFLVVLENTHDGSYVEYDEAPRVTASYGSGSGYGGEWTNEDITVFAYCDSPISGVAGYEYAMIPATGTLTESAWRSDGIRISEDGEASIVVSKDFNGSVYFRAISNADNYTLAASTKVRVQKSAPANATVSVTGKLGNNGWYVKNPAITITPPEHAANTAPISTYYELNSGNPTLFNGENGPKSERDGRYTLTVYTYDAAGNRSADTVKKEILVDTTAPTGLWINAGNTSLLAKDPSAVTFNVYYSAPIHVTMGGNADVSGIASVKYQKVKTANNYSESNWMAYPSSGLDYTPDDHFILYLRVEDNAGNVSITHTDGIVLDKTAPTGEKAPDFTMTMIGANKNGWFSGDATVEISAIDPLVNDTASGLQTLHYEVRTNGTVTQEETVEYGKNGEHLTSVSAKSQNEWKTRVMIPAGQNNSDDIVLTVTITDRTGNSRTSKTTVKIDTTPPILVLSYDNNQVKGGVHFNSNRTLTIMATERNLGNELAVLTVTKDGSPYPVALNWRKQDGKMANGDDTIWTAEVLFEEDGDYKISVSSTDLAGNKASSVSFVSGTECAWAFTIDKTAPVIIVRYNNNESVNDRYFSASRTATVTVIERNFEERDLIVQVTAKRDGKDLKTPEMTSIRRDGDNYTFEIPYLEDGDYTFDISCTDRAGNKAGQVDYGTSASAKQFTVDTSPAEVKVDGIAHGGAYTGTLYGTLAVSDLNEAVGEVRIYKTWLDHIKEDVTDEYLTGSRDTAHGTVYEFNGFNGNHDGIYEIEYSFKDRADHETTGRLTFTINRNGSVYVFSDDLIAAMDGYHKVLDGKYTITEYNPSRLESGKAQIVITRDGEILTDAKWTVTPAAEATTTVGERGWYTYEYEIQPENFTQDGKYTITAMSEDEAGNANQNLDDIAIAFFVDNTAPDLVGVRGLEEAIVNASSIDVEAEFFDNVGLKRVSADIDGKEVTVWERDTETQTIKIHTKVGEGLNQKLTFHAEDMAGNRFNSDDESFNPGFSFHREVTVSTNLFVRLWANPALFFGLLGGIVLAVGGTAIWLIAAKKKKAKKSK